MGPITSEIIDRILLISNTNASQETDQRAIMSDYGISILTRNDLDVKISMTRAIAQLGRAPRLHVRQCFSGESQSKELILLRNRCLTPLIRGNGRTIA